MVRDGLCGETKAGVRAHREEQSGEGGWAVGGRGGAGRGAGTDHTGPSKPRQGVQTHSKCN